MLAKSGAVAYLQGVIAVGKVMDELTLEQGNSVPLSACNFTPDFDFTTVSYSESSLVFSVVDATLPQYFTQDAWGRVLGVYDGAGNPLTESAIGNNILWQGKEYSWKTGLYYNRYRWYDPITGRFISKDPIGISGGLNEYTYCSDNPVNFRDVFGLCTEAKPTARTPDALVRVRQHYTDALNEKGLWNKFFGRQDIQFEPRAFVYEGEVVTSSQAGNMAVGYTAYRLYGFMGAIGICIAGEAGWPDLGNFWSGVQGSFEYNALGVAHGIIDEYKTTGRRIIFQSGRVSLDYGK